MTNLKIGIIAAIILVIVAGCLGTARPTEPEKNHAVVEWEEDIPQGTFQKIYIPGDNNVCYRTMNGYSVALFCFNANAGI